MDTTTETWGSTSLAALLVFASSTVCATEVSVRRAMVGQFEFGSSAFLHPGKATITPADQGMNPHRAQGTMDISGLGDGYQNLLQKCEGARLRNFNIGAKPPNNHLDVGQCTVFRGAERIGTLTYHGTPASPRRALHLEAYTCMETGRRLVEGDGQNEFQPTLAPPDKAFLGGIYTITEIVDFDCSAK